MSDDLKRDALQRLVAVQHLLREVADAAALAADDAKDADAPGLAFAVLMVRESIMAYSKELNRWAKQQLDK